MMSSLERAARSGALSGVRPFCTAAPALPAQRLHPHETHPLRLPSTHRRAAQSPWLSWGPPTKGRSRDATPGVIAEWLPCGEAAARGDNPPLARRSCVVTTGDTACSGRPFHVTVSPEFLPCPTMT